MTRLATVLYEDKMQPGVGGSFPPHDFILSLVADAVNRPTWELARLIDKNPRNGVDKLIQDLPRTDRIAGAGMLYVMVDADRIARHLGLPKTTSLDAVADELKRRSDAPDKLSVHFLRPNLEGLMASIEACAPDRAAPPAKDHNSRDIFFKRAAYGLTPKQRACVRQQQGGVATLVDRLAKQIRATPTAT